MSRFLRLPTYLAIGLLTALAITAAGVLFAGGLARPADAAAGGPVILGGDDLTDHGSISGDTLQEGWLYIRKALENISPNVLRPGNDNSVAVLGSTDSTATDDDAGAAYHFAAPQAGLGVSFHDGATAINQFFTDLANGTVNPAIIVTAGTGAGNDLDSDEGTALTNNATSIANFVNSGGGLLSHGSGVDAYGWLSALLPGASNVSGCDEDTLTLTAAGQTAFPGLTNADITAGPCHSNFTGDLGGLQILAADGQQRNIIIGGANVKLPGSIDLTPSAATNIVGTTHTVTATALDGKPPVPAIGVQVKFAVTSGPNVGASGTCSSNADCTTDANGQVSFTYTGDGGVGTDTISASFVTTREVTESTLVQKTWELPPPTATPTPTPTVLAATATPTPAPTVAALPSAGGTPSDGGSGTLPWLAAIAGAIALIGSGGAWFAHQRRRAR
jgi:hypothetical protein